MFFIIRTILILLVIFGSFLCSRGTDGSLMLSLTFGGVAFIYTAVMFSIFRAKSVRSATAELLLFPTICASLSIVSMLPGSQLDEMAGMLYFIIPIVTFVAVFLGVLIQWIICFVLRKRLKEEADDLLVEAGWDKEVK